jgi:hypothetical protein
MIRIYRPSYVDHVDVVSAYKPSVDAGVTAPLGGERNVAQLDEVFDTMVCLCSVCMCVFACQTFTLFEHRLTLLSNSSLLSNV